MNWYRADEGSVSVAQLEAEFGISKGELHKWRRATKAQGETAFPGKGQLAPQQAQLRDLERENARLQRQIEILKKAAAYFSQEHLP